MSSIFGMPARVAPDPACKVPVRPDNLWIEGLPGRVGNHELPKKRLTIFMRTQASELPYIQNKQDDFILVWLIHHLEARHPKTAGRALPGEEARIGYALVVGVKEVQTVHG
jgi:hypothetical protein